jgi:hydrogenase-4 component F
MMSGVLLNVGVYALIRFKAVTDITLGSAFSSAWLTRFGLLSLGLAAAFLLSQRSYKRMLAYSSVEHTGLVALGLGFGGYWGILGALLHMVNHALTKSMLFILSGSILLKYGTTEIRGIRGLLKAAPWTGSAFLCGVVALLGLPPFGLFISEFAIFRAGFAGSAASAVIGIALVALAFAGMLGSVNSMLYGEPQEIAKGDPVRWPLAPVALNIVFLTVLGVVFPSSARAFFEEVLKIVGISL